MGVLTDKGGAGAWCDDIRTPSRETCAEQVARALTLALADLEKRFGADQTRWSWGVAHAAHSAHRPFSGIPVLGRLFDLRVPTGGDTYTVNVGRHTIRKESDPFANTHAASLRAIYDLANLENSRFMHSTGQSGLVFSPLYGNFTQRWAGVRYIPMRMERSVVEADMLGRLVLKP
jgi:penicillin amidase